MKRILAGFVACAALCAAAAPEITWSVMNAAGDVVCKGGPYTEARKKQVVKSAP